MRERQNVVIQGVLVQIISDTNFWVDGIHYRRSSMHGYSTCTPMVTLKGRHCESTGECFCLGEFQAGARWSDIMNQPDAQVERAFSPQFLEDCEW